MKVAPENVSPEMQDSSTVLHRKPRTVTDKCRKRWLIVVLVVVVLAVGSGIIGYFLSRNDNDGGLGPQAPESTTSPMTTGLPDVPPPYLRGNTGWLTWGQWSSCDVTCGGGSRLRSRSCYSGDESTTCIGDSDQSRECGDWDCPDCSKTCTSGVLDAQCIHCVCDGEVISGKVTDVAGKSLSGVSVYNAEIPITVLATTDQDGFFELVGYCVDQLSMLFRKSKFLDAEWTSSDSSSRRKRNAGEQTFNFTLYRSEPPVVLEHPQNKVRLVGQSVTLCCNAVAKPSVNYYEWFHDDIILDKESYGYNNTLTITGLKKTDSGVYTCRANSETGAQYSLPATLSVLDSSETTCSVTPEQHLLKLPEGCQGNANSGSRFHNIGRCAHQKCPVTSVDGSICTDSQEECCSPVAFDTHSIVCDTFNISVQVVTACGCTPCGKGTITVRGRAGGLDGFPLPLGDIYMEGELVASTTARGAFTFEVLKGKTRLAVTFRDKYNFFVDATKILTLGEETSVFHQVYLERLPAPITINASEVAVIPLGGQLANESNVAELEIPAGAFYNEDGSVYEGDVKATVAFSDPADPSMFNVIASDLMTRDVEGNAQALKTFGMFSMKFQDSSDNPLRVDATVKLYLDAEQANVDLSELDDEENQMPRLWFLNEMSGEWEDIGGLQLVKEKRRKRQTETFLVGNIEVVGYNLDRLPYCNIDRIETWRRHCHLKVRVYSDESMEQPLESVQVTALTNDLIERDRAADQYDGRLSFFQKATTGQDGSACLWTFCARDDTLFSVNVRAKHGDEVLAPVHPDMVPDDKHPSQWPSDLLEDFALPEAADDSGFVTMKALTPQMAYDDPRYDRYYDYYDYEKFDDRDSLGPFYWFWNSPSQARRVCDLADINDNHLVFVKKEKGLEEVEYEDYDIDDPDHIERDRTVHSWYPYEGDQKRACFIKILVDSLENERYIVESHGGGHPEVGDVQYGLRIDNSKPDPPSPGVSSKTAACIEFKCSGPIRRGHPEIDFGLGEIVGGPDTTLLKISPTSSSGSCRLKSGDEGVRPGLVTFLQSQGLENSIQNDTLGYRFKVPSGNINGPTTGLYIGQGPLKDCYEIAYENCLSGDDNGYSQELPLNPDAGWALQYECP